MLAGSDAGICLLPSAHRSCHDDLKESHGASRCHVGRRDLLHRETIPAPATVAGPPAIPLLVVSEVSPEPCGCIASHEHRVLAKFEERLKVAAGAHVAVVVECEANHLEHRFLLSNVS